MSVTWWLLMSISMGLVPFLFRRKIIPGESPMQVVEPSINRHSYSWEQVGNITPFFMRIPSVR